MTESWNAPSGKVEYADGSSIQRAAYEAVVAQGNGAFVLEKPPYFSPAAAAQDKTASGWFGPFAQMLLTSEFTEWADECTAHVKTCYIGDWSPLHKLELRGSGALSFLSWLGMNDLSGFSVGQLKHHVQLDEVGRIASEGIVSRLAEDTFRYTAGTANWLAWQASVGTWDVEITDISPDVFIFGVQGPASLGVLERATGGSLRDIAFNHFRSSEIEGVDVRIMRTGISGELGYEVHGPSGAGNAVWAAIVEAGGEAGIRQLGFRSQAIQHIEAGIATNGLDYLPASAITPGAPTQFRQRAFLGSFVPSGWTDYFRTPGELGWAARAQGDHDYLGREAIEAEAAAGGSRRVHVGLAWNADDVAAVLAAMVGVGDPVDTMELPRYNGLSFDRVMANGADVGVASGRTLSLNLQGTISLCVIDRAFAAVGTPVTVIWGRAGTNQREIRATVTALPFKPDHRRIDVTTL
jgi:glycine cleavage system aminomethyltransferase T